MLASVHVPLALKPLTVFSTLLPDLMSHTVNSTTYAGICARIADLKLLTIIRNALTALPDVLSHTVNGTTCAGIRTRATGP